MIRLKLDDVTNRVLGWENITQYLQTYSTDVMIADDEADGLAIGLYYENGKFVQGPESNYYTEMGALESRVYSLQGEITQGNNRVLSAVLDGTIEDLKEDMEQKEAELAEIKEQIEALKEEHSAQLEALHRSRNKAIDDSLEVQNYSAAVLLIKDENQYLEEWVRWHIALGFDRIYIYDNGSAVPVAETVQKSLSDLAERITVIDFSDPHENLQTEAYTHFKENAGKHVRWAAMLDSDEFLRFPDGSQKLNDYLKIQEEYTAITFPFVEYNANGQETYVDAPVRERFTGEAECRGNMAEKNLIQINRTDGFKTHFPVFDPEKHPVLHPDKETLVMDHYYTKSFQEWCQKMERGSCDPNWLRKFDEFFRYNPDMEYLRDRSGTDQKYGGSADAI